MLLPLVDVLPFRRVPWVTIGTIALHAATFLVQPDAPRAQFSSAGIPPAFGWSGLATAALASATRHTDWLHLASNLAALWLFGSTLEDRLGRRRFALFYVAGTLIAAGSIQVAWPGSVAALGASGGVLGVMTAYLVLFPTARLLALFVPIFWIDVIEIPAVIGMAVWLMLQVTSAAASMASGFGSPMPWPGYAAGAVWGVVIGVTVRAAREWPRR